MEVAIAFSIDIDKILYFSAFFVYSNPFRRTLSQAVNVFLTAVDNVTDRSLLCLVLSIEPWDENSRI
jgi:hypothetical protein